MNAIDDLKTNFSAFAQEMATGFGALDSKLNEIAVFIQAVKDGTVTEAQIIDANTTVTTVRTATKNAMDALFAKADSLDEPSA